MPHARRKRVVRALALAGLLASGCGGEEAPPSAGAGAPEPGSAEGEPETALGDGLLRRAREGIREGALPEELRAEVLGSTAPEHARARRVLLAMVESPPGTDGGNDDEVGSDDARSRPPPILPPAEGEALAEAGAPDGGVRPKDGGRAESGGRSGSAAAPHPAGADRPVRGKGRAELGGLALRSTKNGATLTIAAPSSLVVGVANQPASGIVRLVIESAQAGSAMLHARPRTEGAAVTGVRQGQGTVQITIRLEPGWSLGSVQPFSGGAKVHLLAPP